MTVFNTTTFENILVAFVTAVFTPPQNMSTVLAQDNLTTWMGVLNSTIITNASSINTTVLQQLETQRGFTAFVPSNEALSEFNLGSLEGNNTNLAIIVQNHVSVGGLGF